MQNACTYSLTLTNLFKCSSLFFNTVFFIFSSFFLILNLNQIHADSRSPSVSDNRYHSPSHQRVNDSVTISTIASISRSGSGLGSSSKGVAERYEFPQNKIFCIYYPFLISFLLLIIGCFIIRELRIHFSEQYHTLVFAIKTIMHFTDMNYFYH